MLELLQGLVIVLPLWCGASLSFLKLSRVTTIRHHVLLIRDSCAVVIQRVFVPSPNKVSIAEAFHHAWSSFGCGKMFFTKSDVRIRTGRKTCFTLWAGSEGGKHLYPWGFFDSRTRRQDVPDLERLIGLRGYLPFGACRFLAPGCSYATVLLDPVARYLTHVHWECTHGHPFKECESLAEYTHKAIRGQVGFYGIDNYQTRMLAAWLFDLDP